MSESQREPGQTREKGLASLAEVLLARHLQVSWPPRQESARSWFKGRKRLDGSDSELRTVAVVGAGASIPMVSVADELADRLEDEYGGDKQDREAELDRLQKVYGADPKHFETRLVAICRATEAERKVRAAIAKDYRLKHPSLLTYELLAHLLKHRFLDAIISFNFDELLDQSIEDELGPNEYTRVVTERDWDPEYPVSSPLYIKMHGTASEPESLRFTQESYYWTPKSINALVEKQFDVEHLVLLNIGFKMASFDFQYALRKPKELRIYHLDPHALARDVIKEVKKQRKKERELRADDSPESNDEPRPVSFHSLARGPGGPTFLEDLLLRLCSEMQACSRKPAAGPAHWRSTIRHETAVKLLRGTDTGEHNHYINYLRRRTILEIAFAAAKGRGVVSIAAMVSDERCGRYYDVYRRIAGHDAQAWSNLCRAGGLVESSDSPDTYEMLPSVCKKPSKAEEKVPKMHRLEFAHPGKLAKHVLRSMDPDPAKTDDLTTLLTKTLTSLQSDTEIEVHSRDDRVCSKIFTRPVILTTLTALKGWTNVMLKQEDYDELRVVAETGEWLQRDVDLKPAHGTLTVKLIVAFDLGSSSYGENVKVELLWIPWWRHNRHMTILCKDGTPQSAIYFARRLRASSVTPVYLTDQADLTRLANAFERLQEEARWSAERALRTLTRPSTFVTSGGGGRWQ
jgi:hypothetical protein